MMNTRRMYAQWNKNMNFSLGVFDLTKKLTLLQLRSVSILQAMVCVDKDVHYNIRVEWKTATL